MKNREYLDSREIVIDDIFVAEQGFAIKGTSKNVQVRYTRAGEPYWYRAKMLEIYTREDPETAVVERLVRYLKSSETPCTRCGGAGGWKHWPGYTCYRCNGTGVDPTAQ